MGSPSASLDLILSDLKRPKSRSCTHILKGRRSIMHTFAGTIFGMVWYWYIFYWRITLDRVRYLHFIQNYNFKAFSSHTVLQNRYPLYRTHISYYAWKGWIFSRPFFFGGCTYYQQKAFLGPHYFWFFISCSRNSLHFYRLDLWLAWRFFLFYQIYESKLRAPWEVSISPPVSTSVIKNHVGIEKFPS